MLSGTGAVLKSLGTPLGVVAVGRHLERIGYVRTVKTGDVEKVLRNGVRKKSIN